MAFLRDFIRSKSEILPEGVTMGRNPVAGLTHIKVLMLVDDVPTRIYPFWASRIIEQKDDLTKDVDDALFNEENIDRTVIHKKRFFNSIRLQMCVLL
jgi:hypothetical protein